METDAAVDKITDLQFLSTAAWKSLLAFRTVSTGSAAINLTHQNRTFHLLQKPDIFTCYRHNFPFLCRGDLFQQLSGYRIPETHRIFVRGHGAPAIRRKEKIIAVALTSHCEKAGRPRESAARLEANQRLATLELHRCYLVLDDACIHRCSVR